MEIGPIDRNTYTDFILQWLEKGQITASARDLQLIFELGVDVPYNIQRICNNMWDLAQKEVTNLLIILCRIGLIL